MSGPTEPFGEPGVTRPVDPPDGRGDRARWFHDWFGGPWVWVAVGAVALVALVIVLTVDTSGPDEPVARPPSESATTAIAPTPSSTVPAPSPTTSTTSTSLPDATTLPASTTPDSWTMPDLRGEDLDDAKSSVKTLTDGGSGSVKSTDASGDGRRQFIDGNWEVCSQSPQAGATLWRDAGVELRVVKHGETCPDDPAVVGASHHG